MALRTGLFCGSVAVVVLLLLIGDWVVAARRDADTSRLDALGRQVKTDADVAPRLEQELESRTDRSLARQARSRVYAWVLLASVAGFVAAGQRYVALRPPPTPDLGTLLAEQCAPQRVAAERASGRRERAPANGGSNDTAPVDRLIAQFGSGREAAIPILQGIQRHYRYLPDEALRHLCERTEITAAQITGTSSFYAQFRRRPMGRHLVRICHGTACHVAGATQLTDELRRHLQILPDEDTDATKTFTLEVVACVGCCSLAPVIVLGEETAGRLTPASARRALDELGSAT